MKLSPSGNRVLIKPEDAIDKTKGGILLPDSAKEKPLRGKVVAKGLGKRNDDGSYQKIEFDEGTTVYYTRYGGEQVTLDGEEFLIVDADKILAELS